MVASVSSGEDLAVANLQDVAREAGVSVATVSRVLNGSAGVATETATAVRRALDTTGYRRQPERGGRPVGSKVVRLAKAALLIPDTSLAAMQTPLTGQLVHGAGSVLEAGGASLFLTRLGEDGSLPACLAKGEADGLLVRVGASLARLEQELPERPLVWVFQAQRNPARGDMVHPDNEAVGQLAADYLLAQKRDVVFLPQPGKHCAARVRIEACQRRAREVGLTVRALPMARNQAVLLQAVLAEPEGAAGVFLPIGEGLLEALVRGLREGGRQPVGDVEIISCNNDAARLGALDPRLPNLDIRGAEVGRAAAEALFWRLEHRDEPQRRILISPQLVPGAGGRS